MRRRIDRFEIAVGGERLVVTSMPAGDGAAILEALTRAERAVARDAIAGLSNAAIARKRKRAARTVANQLASVYRKLRVGSRAELAALVLGERSARGRMRREDPHAASEMWTALVGGQRERAIAHLAALGKSNKLIAYELGIAESTVATHLASAMRKLGVRSRLRLVHVLASLTPAR